MKQGIILESVDGSLKTYTDIDYLSVTPDYIVSLRKQIENSAIKFRSASR